MMRCDIILYMVLVDPFSVMPKGTLVLTMEKDSLANDCLELYLEQRGDAPSTDGATSKAAMAISCADSKSGLKPL